MRQIQSSKLYQLYFPVFRRCGGCHRAKIASAVQILSGNLTNRQRYFCVDCATQRGKPPSKHLLSCNIDELEDLSKRSQLQRGREQQPKQKKAKARSTGK
jgi:hypothetical protein